MNRIGFGALLERADHGLEALLEIAAVAGAGEQRPGVEREDLGVLRGPPGSSSEEPLGQALHDRGLAHAGLAHEHRVVLAPAAEHLERAAHLRAGR